MAEKTHVNLVVVCALGLELEATKGLIEYQTGSKFMGKDEYPPGVVVCEWQWNSTSFTVALASQADTGGSECQVLVSKLAEYFTANAVVMTGICAGDEKKLSLGSVVVAKETIWFEGGKELASGVTRVNAKHCLLQVLPDCMKTILGEAVSSASANPQVWLDYVPQESRCDSPRLVRQYILQCLEENPKGLTAKKLIDSVTEQLSGVTRNACEEVLQVMQKDEHPCIKQNDVFCLTDEGKGYITRHPNFLAADEITAVFEPMLTLVNVTENLQTSLQLARESGTRKTIAADMESYHFMRQANSSFGGAKVMVMKAVSDWGSKSSKVDYYQSYAASLSVAFLWHLINTKKFLFEKQPSQATPVSTSQQPSQASLLSTSQSDRAPPPLVPEHAFRDSQGSKLVYKNMSNAHTLN
ncbi:uncharacterized protein LOC134191236 isoform X2 [Corticium candelabrum]|uniref:uncharacterized protein LOC134191236 isoform X2 n=1 Tax=Corticium candelabrum TaxID=121492 RepID=UPI002E25DA49|nr:uncharacterized protein LOC134191236 isoform X2 [Corticium candelabrum]